MELIIIFYLFIVYFEFSYNFIIFEIWSAVNITIVSMLVKLSYKSSGKLAVDIDILFNEEYIFGSFLQDVFVFAIQIFFYLLIKLFSKL